MVPDADYKYFNLTINGTNMYNVSNKKTIFPDNEAHIVYSLIQMENDSDSLFWNVTAAGLAKPGILL